MLRGLSLVAVFVSSAIAKPLPPTLPSAHADAFTSTPYCGNPACVVLLPPSEFPKKAWMQKVALEMHLSETVRRPEPN